MEQRKKEEEDNMEFKRQKSTMMIDMMGTGKDEYTLNKSLNVSFTHLFPSQIYNVGRINGGGISHANMIMMEAKKEDNELDKGALMEGDVTNILNLKSGIYEMKELFHQLDMV